MCPSLSIRILSGLISLKQNNQREKTVSGYALDDLRISVTFGHSPMDETKVMHGLDRKNALCDVEPGHVLGEGIVLDQHRHQVSSRQELHDEIQVCWVLK